MRQSRCFRVRQEAVLGVILFSAFNPVAWPLPQGPVVVNGQVVVSQPAAGTMQVQASNGAIINWNQFSIGAGEVTRFIQPSASSAVLNRVIGTDPSQILGRLEANGRVFLINPHGIVIGRGARIDTNGFIASTLDMANADFLAGKLKFFATPNSAGISNQGVITAGPGGSIALIAPHIENSGIIQAPDGHLLLAAGHKLEIASMDMQGVKFEIQAPTDSVLNLGKLLADNGAVQAFAGTLRQSGEIRANRLVQDGDGSIRLVGTSEVTLTSDSVTRADGITGGAITIQSPGGTARIGGVVSARGDDGKGGDIRLLGERIAVESGALADASGAAGGGQVLVGGDFQGKNPEVQNASRVYVGAGAMLRADATQAGDGGKVVVWSNENTRYFGALSVRGGPNGGNGGKAEVSGKHNLQFAGAADLSAPAGTQGFLLLDPLDIIISSTGGILPSVVDEFADFSNNIVTISPSGLNAIAGNVVLQADRNIYVKSGVNLTTVGAGLTAEAGGTNHNNGQIYLEQGITTTGGAVSLSGSTVSGSGGISTGGGAVSLTATGSLNYSSLISSGGGNVSLSAGGSVNNAYVNAGAGNISVSAPGGVNYGNYASSGTVTLASSGGSVYGNSVTAGTAVLNAASQVYSYVNAANRIDATSSGSSIQLYNLAGQPLRIGTINGQAGVYLTSDAGFRQVSGGSITAPSVTLYGQNASATAGTASAPLAVASPSLELYQLGGAAYVAFSGNPTLSRLYLQGTVAALGASSFTGASNLSTFALGAGSGVLNANVVATGGFGSGLTFDVTDGGINAATLTVPGGGVNLYARDGITLGTANVGQLYATAGGPVSITSATATAGGISIYAQKCSYYYSCAYDSPITVGSLSASGNIYIYSSDNGTIGINSLNAGGNASIYAGDHYYWNSRTSAVNLGSATTGSGLSVYNYGTGDIAASGNLGATYGNIALSASNGAVTVGGNLSSTYGAIALSAGNGGVTANGSLTAGSNISLSATNGSLSATGTVSAGSSASFSSSSGTVALGNVTSGNYGVSATANGDLTFQSITANGYSGSVTLTSTQGGVQTTVNNAAADIAASGDVTITATNAANGSIGNAAFAHPLDILAGASNTVILTAGAKVGAAGKAVTVDTNGAIKVNAGKDFHVAAQDTSGNAKTVKDIELTTSAAGIGAGHSATFSSQDLSVTATSNGSTITLGNIVQSANTLDKFSFTASGTSGLAFRNVNLTTGGLNQFFLTSGGALNQLSGNINAGNIGLSAAGAITLGNVTSSGVPGSALNISGTDITAGNLSAPSLSVTGANLTLGTVTTTGTHRGYYDGYVCNSLYCNYLTESLNLTASGTLSAGAITSATSATVSANGLTVAGGSGNIAAGTVDSRDSLTVNAGTGTLAAGVLSGYNVNASAATLSTGDMTATGNLSIATTGAYQPGTIALSGGNSVSITAPDGIDLVTNAATVTAPTVTLRAAGSGSAVRADLTGTTSLTLESGGTFNVVSSGTLTSLDVTAPTDVFGSHSVSAGAGYQSFGYNFDGPLFLGVHSSTPLAMRYTDTSASQYDMVASAVMSGGSFYLSAPTANIATSTISTGGGSLTLATARNITLGAVSTSGGSVDAHTTGGDINVDSVTTAGGGVTLRADAGSILATGAGQIDTGVGMASPVPAGSVTLAAGAGSIGAAATPLKVYNTVSLDLTALNEIAVDAGSAALTNLSITTNASGTGSLSVTNANFGGFSLTRNGTNLDLGPVTPTSAGSFSLTARDGSIRVTDNISNLSSLSLNAGYGSNTVSDILIQASGSTPLSVSAGQIDLRAGRNVIVGAGNAAGGNVSVTSSAGGSNIYAGNDIKVLGNGGSALLAQTSPSYYTQYLQAGHDIRIVGGSAGIAGASAATTSTGSQTFSAGNDLVLQAGSANGASAQASAAGGQSVNVNNLTVAGGGNNASASLSGAYQSMATIHGNVSVLGGSGTGAFAEIVATTSSSQNIGSQSTYANDPTDQVLIQGGTGGGAYASIRSAGSQSVYGTGDIQVLGGSGAGAYAEITSTSGSQTVGSNYTGYALPTANILVQAGSGGIAKILAAGNQSVMAGGNIDVNGGSGTGMTAAIETTGGSQTVGSSYTYYGYYNPTDNVRVHGGTASGAAAWIKAANGQTIEAGQSISVTGGVAGAYAEIVNTAGSQSIGNLGSYYYDQTDTIVLQGGSGNGAWANVVSGGGQTVGATTGITLAGGSGDSADARFQAAGAQSVQTYGNLSLTGGSAVATGVNRTWIETTGTSQTITVGGNIAVTGGGNGSKTYISQTNAGGGTQTITAGGSLSIAAVTANSGNTGIDATGGANSQTIQVGGAITLDNQGGQSVYLASDGSQSVQAASLDLRLSSPLASAETVMAAGGAQDIRLMGTGIAGSATLSVVNSSAATGSIASISAGGNQTILMDYDSAGRMQIGSTTAQGQSLVSAGGAQTVVAGDLLVQGGASAAATSKLQATGNMTVSTIGGPVQVLGGSAGAASIDPTLLDMVANGDVLVQGGIAPTATATISAGNINMAATNGNMLMTGGTAGGALASVIANAASGTFNLVGSGGLTFTQNTGGASITAPGGGNIQLIGPCNGCAGGLFGPFNVSAYVAPPPPVVPASSGSSLVDLLTADILALLDGSAGSQQLFELLALSQEESGLLIDLGQRRVRQCY